MILRRAACYSMVRVCLFWTQMLNFVIAACLLVIKICSNMLTGKSDWGEVLAIIVPDRSEPRQFQRLVRHVRSRSEAPNKQQRREDDFEPYP